MTRPAQLFAPERGQARPALFDERWAFYTREPRTTLITIDMAGPGQSLSRSERERTVELRLLQSQFPKTAQTGSVTIQGRPGMLICGQRLLVRRVLVTADPHAPESGRVLWRQAVTVTC
jgi:hypothetical protein